MQQIGEIKVNGSLMDIPPGNSTYIAIEHDHLYVVDLPIKNCDFL